MAGKSKSNTASNTGKSKKRIARGRASGLTLKQKLFAEHYLGKAKGNATEAARLAGYAGDYDVLRVVGAENLTKPNIRDYIAKRFKEAAQVSADEVMTVLGRQMRGDIGDFLTANDVLITEDDSVEGKRYVRLTGINPFGGDTRLIHKYRKSDKGESIELYSSFDAAKEIAELMGMKVQRHVFSGPQDGDIPIRLSGDLPPSEQLVQSLATRLAGASPEERVQLLQLGEQLFSVATALGSKLKPGEDGTNRPEEDTQLE